MTFFFFCATIQRDHKSPDWIKQDLRNLKTLLVFLQNELNHLIKGHGKGQFFLGSGILKEGAVIFFYASNKRLMASIFGKT